MAPPGKTSFSVVRKKTPFQKAKAEEELKRKRHAEEAAKLYDEFAASFEADKKPRGMNFVSAGTQAAGSRPGEEVADDGRREAYVPPNAPPAVAEASEAIARTLETASTSTPMGTGSMKPSGGGKAGKPRAIDALMGEMIAKQQERERARREGHDVDAGDHRRARGDGDDTSTNLFVGNLPRDVDEDVVKRAFAKYGPIGSVKIMWPREDEDVRLRTQLSGFVAFMTRSSAERAREEMDGAILGRHDLRVSWGKAVPLPEKPVWPLATREEIRPGEGNFSAAERLRASMRPPAGDAARVLATPGAADLVVRYPGDDRITALIDALARYVAEDGYLFEKAVMERERENEDFSFLFDVTKPERAYYRWRVFSLSQGDSLARWRVEPFAMVAGGPRWVPPDPAKRPDASQASATIGKGSRVFDETRLTPSEAEAFRGLLETLSLERRDIERGMLFALDRAEAADDVAELLVDALAASETAVAAKTARLFLVSDILHNCGAPVRNASAYRGAFQARLPRAFESLRSTLRGMTSRIAREAFKKRVGSVLAAWSDWYLFQSEFLRGLEASFLLEAPDVTAEELNAVRREIDAMDAEARERACRAKGLVADGGAEACAARLVEVELHLRASSAASAVKQ
jgi:U2-associated protein SR140